ncbi:MAG: hypothetical protein U0T79_12855 [Ferruginibacter sp.]
MQGHPAIAEDAFRHAVYNNLMIVFTSHACAGLHHQHAVTNRLDTVSCRQLPGFRDDGYASSRTAMHPLYGSAICEAAYFVPATSLA